MYRLLVGAILALWLAAPNAGAAPITLDSFSTTTNLGPNPMVGMFVNAGSPGPTTVIDPGTVINDGAGTRTVTLGAFSGTGLFVSTTVAGGVLDLSSSTDSKASLTLSYSGLNRDLSGHDSIQLDVLNFDFAFSQDLPITATISDGTNSSSQMFTVTAGGSTPVDFALSGFSGVNMTNVQSISLHFANENAHNFTVDDIVITQAAIPEPTTLAVWGLVGLAGAWYARRRLQPEDAPTDVAA